jgi:hypothetical protein
LEDTKNDAKNIPANQLAMGNWQFARDVDFRANSLIANFQFACCLLLIAY